MLLNRSMISKEVFPSIKYTYDGGDLDLFNDDDNNDGSRNKSNKCSFQ